jgi:hypothetical protein
MKRPTMADNQCIGTPVWWTQDSLREKCYHVTQLRSLEELYPRPGVHDHLSEFFLLNVVLNHARPLQGEGVAHLAEHDPDAVALASAYNDGNFEDRKMTSTVLSLPSFLGLVSSIAIVSDGNRRHALRIHSCRWT